MREVIKFVCDTIEKLYSEAEVAALVENQAEFSRVINETLVMYSQKQYLSENKAQETTQSRLKFVQGLMGAIKQPKYIFEAGIPHYSTGINVLEDLLKKIVPILETDYKKLTTDKAQRESFKEHILNATINALKSPRLYQSNEQSITMGETPPSDGPLDRTKKLEDENANFSQLDTEAGAIGSLDDTSKKIEINKSDKSKDADYEMFLIPDQDKTGANMAYNCFKKIGRMILEAYQVLDNQTDKDTFYEFLIANLKLYTQKFEEEIIMDLPPDKKQAIDSIEEQPETPTSVQTDNELAGLDIQPNSPV